MLQIDKVQTLEGITVFGDHEFFNVFYPLPQQPRYRRDAQGRPSFGFFKYRFPVDRPDGTKGGGFVVFDVEFVVDETKMVALRQKLEEQIVQEANRRGISPVPPLIIGSFTYTKGTSALLYPETFVKRTVPNGGKPSLFGNNVSTFALELTQEGATFFEQAMQGQGGAVSIVYDLWFWARMPQAKITATFNATKFYSFYQTIDTDWNFWAEDSYRETLREQMIQTESLLIEPEFPASMPQKVQDSLRDWATRALEEAVERNMIEAIAPVSEDKRKAPDGIEDVTRDISSTKISSITINYREAQSVEWNVAPQGILPNITSLTDAGGAPIKWADYAQVIEIDDPLFKTLRVNALVNADFKNLPIHSVEVKLLYQGRPMANLVEGEPDGEVVLNSEDDLGKFAAFVEKDDWKYRYSYQVNYRGESRQFQSEELETNEGTLTIGVDDVGIVAVEASAGDLNWSELDRVDVVLTYEDAENGVPPLEERFQLTQAAPTHKVQHVIFQPMRNDYHYKVKYFMKGGKEYDGPERTGRSDHLFVNDVFDARKVISVRGVGDFANRVQMVHVNLEYKDEANKYTQEKSQALSAATPFFDWAIPVISETAGVITYSALISYKDGTSEEVPPTVAESNTIILPPPTQAFMEVQVVTDLIDWEAVRLVSVALSYEDKDSKVENAKTLIFSPTNKSNVVWKVEQKNRLVNDFTYSTNYYLADGRQKPGTPRTTQDRALILDHRA
jgi:hypothetical protein